MAKVLIKVSTNKVGSQMQRTIELDKETIQDEELLNEIIGEHVNEMINVDYEIAEE